MSASAPDSSEVTAAPEKRITKVEDIRRLTREMANRGLKVKIQGVVTFAQPQWGNLFIQDDTGGIGSWPWLQGSNAKAGDWVEYEGMTEQTGFGPALRPSKVTVLGTAQFPPPLAHSLSYMLTGRDDAQWVEIEGVVRRSNNQNLHVALEGGEIMAWIQDFMGKSAESLVDTAVRVRGVCLPNWNDRKQIIGIRLGTPSLAQVTVLQAPPADPFGIPVSSIAELMRYDPDFSGLGTMSHRVRIRGVVSARANGMLFIQDDTSGARVAWTGPAPAKPGDRVEVVGFAKISGFSPMLTDTLIRRTGHATLPVPVPAGADELFSGNLDATRIRTRGRLIESAVQGTNQILQLQVDSRVVRAFLPVAAKLSIPAGSSLQIDAVCSMSGRDLSSVAHDPPEQRSADLFVDSAEDIAITARPPWWTLEHTLGTIGLLLTATLGALAWVLSLRRKVEERTQDLTREIAERIRIEEQMEKTHKLLVDASRRAGMAEVATGVLHNVGNVLNSVNISCQVVAGQITQSDPARLEKLATLMEQHTGDPAFFTANGNGRIFPSYIRKLARQLASDRTSVLKEVNSLAENVEHIRSIVAMQQSHASVGSIKERVNLCDLMEDALRLSGQGSERHSIKLLRDFEPVPDLEVEKHKLLLILVNLIHNAEHACDASPRQDKQIELRLARNGDGRVKIQVCDNGVGVAPENLTRIFAHGFTTRKDGHGFGLHSGALAARELGGTLTAHSDGVGRGAVFTLELPWPV